MACGGYVLPSWNCGEIGRVEGALGARAAGCCGSRRSRWSGRAEPARMQGRRATRMRRSWRLLLSTLLEDPPLPLNQGPHERLMSTPIAARRKPLTRRSVAVSSPAARIRASRGGAIAPWPGEGHAKRQLGGQGECWRSFSVRGFRDRDRCWLRRLCAARIARARTPSVRPSSRTRTRGPSPNTAPRAPSRSSATPDTKKRIKPFSGRLQARHQQLLKAAATTRPGSRRTPPGTAPASS